MTNVGGLMGLPFFLFDFALPLPLLVLTFIRLLDKLKVASGLVEVESDFNSFLDQLNTHCLLLSFVTVDTNSAIHQRSH